MVFSPDDASDSALDSVMPMKGKIHYQLFPVPRRSVMRCRVVVTISLLMVLTILHGTA